MTAQVERTKLIGLAKKWLKAQRSPADIVEQMVIKGQPRGDAEAITYEARLDLHDDNPFHWQKPERPTPPRVTGEAPPSSLVPPPINRAKIAAAQQKLKENDRSIVTTAKLTAAADRLKAALTKEELEGFNKNIRLKSGGLTYDDLAFVGLIHFESVTYNGQDDPDFRNTSPFWRIQEASVEFGYRKRPFDERQVRWALDILASLDITEEVRKAKRIPGQKGIAGVWSLTTHPYWTDVFTPPERRS